MSNYKKVSKAPVTERLTMGAPKASRFDLSHSHKTTFDTGKLVPILNKEIVPGDHFQIDLTAVLRGSTLLAPVMDNAIIDVRAFFVPHRLVWRNGKRFMGENKISRFYDPLLALNIPRVQVPSAGFRHWDIGAYLGIPVEQGGNRFVNHLPFRAYVKIVNEGYRDQNWEMPLMEKDGDGDYTPESSGVATSYERPIAGGDLYVVNKDRDLFTSALPKPQKGDDVLIDILSAVQLGAKTANKGLDTPVFAMQPNGYSGGSNYSTGYVGYETTSTDVLRALTLRRTDATADQQIKLHQSLKTQDLLDMLEVQTGARALNVVQLRRLFAQQRFLEKDAIAGSRYPELLYSHYGVDIGDARVQLPEYLGGFREYINCQQVPQTSNTVSSGTDKSPQGNLSAYTLTNTGTRSLVNKSFVEHGTLMVLACVKTVQSYQYALPAEFLYRTRLDLFYPEFDRIGEVPLKQDILKFQKTTALGDVVIGYQKSHFEYKYGVNRVSGHLHSSVIDSVDYYHYAEEHTTAGLAIGENFLKQKKTEVDRSLIVSSKLHEQWLADFYFGIKAIRPMALHSSPKLIG